MSSGPITGNSNTTVTVCGDNNTVQICQCPVIQLHRPQPRTPRFEREILLSHNETVPFYAREFELNRISAWLDTPDAISVLTFTGPGGSGKTRLAIELFRRYEVAFATGFITAFHPPTSLAATSSQTPSTQRPLFAVVDYAASHAEHLRQFLEDLAQYGTHLPKLRILLLERFADPQTGWYQRLFNYSHTQYTPGLFAQPEPIPLTPISELTHRRAIFEEALAASESFHPNTPRPGDNIDGKLLQRDQYRDPLVLMMAALASWDIGIYGALHLSRPELAVELARRERSRLAKHHPSRLLPHVAAHMTLCGGLDRQALLDAATEESGALRIQYKDGPGDLAADIAELLPGPIQPEIIGEAFILDVKPDGIGRAAKRKGANVVSTLARALQDFYDPYRVRANNRLDIDTSQPAQWLRELAEKAREGDLQLLLQISTNLPHVSLELASIAASVDEKLLSMLPSSEEDERARLLNNLGARLTELGQWDAAAKATGEAVSIRRRRASAQPDVYQSLLAMTLSNFAMTLIQLGRRTEALIAANEAVNIYRLLAEAQPSEHRPGLAKSLSNQSIALARSGHREEALNLVREAVEIYRELTEQRPDEYLSGLAMALTNFGNLLFDLRQPADATLALREAVEIRRRLAAARPDAHLPALAISLNNYATGLSALGKNEDALEAAREAMEIRQKLASTLPTAFLCDYATSLSNYANRLRESGNLEEALAVAYEATKILRQLATPDPTTIHPYLAAAIHNYAIVLRESGQCEAACKANHEAVEIRRELSKVYPDSYLPDLAGSLANYGNALSQLGRREDALTVVRETIEIYRRLAATRPETFSPRLARSLGALADVLGEPGQSGAILLEALQTLLPYFLQSPKEHAPLMSALASRYISACGQSIATPDSQLLERIVPVLKSMQLQLPPQETLND